MHLEAYEIAQATVLPGIPAVYVVVCTLEEGVVRARGSGSGRAIQRALLNGRYAEQDTSFSSWLLVYI